MHDLVPIIAILSVFGIPISAIWLSHAQKMAKIKAERGTNLPPNVVAELTALREEVAHLRETTTRFDMSFDAALTRLEERVDTVEIKQTGPVTAPTQILRPTQETANTQTLGQGR